MISKEIPDPEDSAEDSSNDDDVADSDEEDVIGSGEAGVRKVVNEVGGKEVEYVQQAVKYSSLSYYIMKLSFLITQVFKENNKARENLFSHMFDFGDKVEQMNGIRAVSYYIDVGTIKYQYCLTNSPPLY